MSANGAAMFARFAFPPNTLGYCGPDAADELYAYGAALQPADGGIAHLAKAFDGAWPYLEVLNTAADHDDPLDERVVEAYWIGNGLLNRVDGHRWGDHLTGRFTSRGRSAVDRITAAAGTAGPANHAFHVFAVYPWIGLLREGRAGPEPLRVMDRCRIRWGRVHAVTGAAAVVESRPLRWDGHRLVLGAPERERVELGDPAGPLAGAVAPGDTVALHWDWVCHRLTPRQAAWLRAVTMSQLEASAATPLSV